MVFSQILFGTPRPSSAWRTEHAAYGLVFRSQTLKQAKHVADHTKFLCPSVRGMLCDTGSGRLWNKHTVLWTAWNTRKRELMEQYYLTHPRICSNGTRSGIIEHTWKSACQMRQGLSFSGKTQKQIWYVEQGWLFPGRYKRVEFSAHGTESVILWYN